MKTQRNILVAFLLNLAFSAFELFGGIFTGSVAILSDAIHDLGDALSIGLSYFLEKKSRKKPDGVYTYGYARYSVLGGVITTCVLLIGSGAVIVNAVGRLLNPSPIHYDGMILFAVVGLIVNGAAAFVTREGDSLNQRAVNLHMLEDVLGWAVVLVGAVIMRFTDISMIDPLMSIAIAVFILINACGNLKEVLDLFLEKLPHGVDVEEIKHHLCHIEGILDVHHIHIWSMDGQSNYATMHVVASRDPAELKALVRSELKEHGVVHATLEFETETESCQARDCSVTHTCSHTHGHHHHHHHH